MKREYRYTGTSAALALFFGRFTIRWAVLETDEGYDSFWFTKTEAHAHLGKMLPELSVHYDADELDDIYEIFPVIIEVECRDEQTVWQITKEEFDVLAAECEVVEMDK